MQCPRCSGGLTQFDVKSSQHTCLGCSARWEVKWELTCPLGTCKRSIDMNLIVRNGKPGQWSPCAGCGLHVSHADAVRSIVYV